MNSPHRLAALIAALYVAFALAYGVANPPFEATDEVRHFRYIRYLALNRALPPVSVEASKELQAHHPPLYYVLAALLSAPISSPVGIDYAPSINPFWGFRYFEPSTDNKNQYLHSPDDRWPFASSTNLILFVGRWLSTLFGLGSVLMAYALGRALFPDRPGIGLGAMVLVAFNPTLLHSASSVNNDAAAAFFGSWAVVESALIAERGASRWGAIRLGAALGLGLMAKVSVGVLGVSALAAFAMRALRQKNWEASIGSFGITLLVAGALSGWWFVRNYLSAGDVLGAGDYQSAWVGEADQARLIREAISGLPYAWTTVWARFDYGQVVLPQWMYAAWGILCLIAFAGLVRHLKQLQSPGMWIVLLALLASVAGWGALMITIPATAHARHILYAYPAAALLIVLGWHGLMPKEFGIRQWGLGFVGLLFSLYALFGCLAPAFAYPHTVSSLPADTTPALADFEGAAEIVGYRISEAEIRPGERLDVAVYWKPLAQTATPLRAFIHLVDSHGILVAQRDTYPGLGNAVTTTWQVGTTFVDTYRVFLPDTAYAPEALTIRVGLWNESESRPLIVGDADALQIGSASLIPRSGDVPNPVRINFNDKLDLIGYSVDKRIAAPGDTIVLTTYWRAVQPDADYWAYAHVVGADGEIWGLADSVIIPLVTRWEPDTTTVEDRRITLAPDTPPGQYTFEFGVTRVSEAEQERLKVLADDGHEIGDHIELTRIRVEP